jgi:hypothetical protein
MEWMHALNPSAHVIHSTNYSDEQTRWHSKTLTGNGGNVHVIHSFNFVVECLGLV